MLPSFWHSIMCCLSVQSMQRITPIPYHYRECLAMMSLLNVLLGSATGERGGSKSLSGRLAAIGKFRKLCGNFELNHVNDDLNTPGFSFIILDQSCKKQSMLRIHPARVSKLNLDNTFQDLLSNFQVVKFS